jgi:hypothetical protein
MSVQGRGSFGGGVPMYKCRYRVRRPIEAERHTSRPAGFLSDRTVPELYGREAAAGTRA